ncbi:MAG: Mrp/NBP35 family ATP-binding protein [Bacteroidales bacterium]|nr:Mrp/NBP35 family ATP-binding protein [Bacteroidales bacterium]
MNKEDILSALAEVTHPAKDDRGIVELGMVESVEVKGDEVAVVLAFPKHRDPLADYLIGSSRAAVLRHFPSAKVEVSTVVKEVADGGPKTPALDGRELEGVRHIIGIGSGKGGVGKSTVAVNLAVALARAGYKVALADADVYGPSVPVMTGTEGVVPEAFHDSESDRDVIMPVEKFGVKWMSIGYFAGHGQALIWRGPMATSALKQLLLQVRWGELDFLLVDMPPGTGDIHISLVQDIPFEGAVIVTTPQEVALADVEKAVDMFRNKNVNKRIFGLVENMAWFSPEDMPEKRYFIFGEGGGVRMAARYGIPLLGQIPIVEGIRTGGDEGRPVALDSARADGAAFMALAMSLVASAEDPLGE